MSINVGDPIAAHYVVNPTNASANPNVEYSIIDRIDGQIIQPNAKKPLLVYAPNGQPILRFNQENYIVLPLKNANRPTHRWGWAMWLKRSVNGATETFCSYSIGTNGANINHIYVTLATSNRYNCDIYADNANSRAAVTPNNTAGTNSFNFVYLAFDGDGATEMDRLKIFVNGVLQVCTYAGSATMPTRLRTNPTGNIIVGGFATDSTVQALRGDIGPDIWVFNDNVSPAFLQTLMNLRPCK